MSQRLEINVPDIGKFQNVPVIEVLVKPGDNLAAEDALITLESDKATMDVPCPSAGKLVELYVAVGDRVSEGSRIALVEVQEGQASAQASAIGSVPSLEKTAGPAAALAAPAAPPPVLPAAPASVSADCRPAHASPSVRLFARQLGVDLSLVTPSGPKARVLKEDVSAFVSRALTKAPEAAPQVAASQSAAPFADLPPWPQIDFSAIGPVERQPLPRIKKISGKNLARNWAMIPAVTYCEEADVTELEAFRQTLNRENEKSETPLKITLLAFVIKACGIALRQFPEFNSSLEGDHLVLKKYIHIAFAADTPHGLVVPVIKNADAKTVGDIAAETAALSKKARSGKLSPADMSDACFTVSSLGGIGVTHFSPIVNAPEVAILGLGRTMTQPVWNGKEFVPRLILPLSLSADHRVIDGALGARFCVFLTRLLADMRRALI